MKEICLSSEVTEQVEHTQLIFHGQSIALTCIVGHMNGQSGRDNRKMLNHPKVA